MQVSDAPPPAPASPAGRDLTGGVADDRASDGRPRPGQRLRSALEGKRRHAPGGGAQGAASAAGRAVWFRAETGAPSSESIGVAGPSAARAVDRVLIGSGPEGAQARIRIGAGALAGTEIQLTGGAAGQAVEARL